MLKKIIYILSLSLIFAPISFSNQLIEIGKINLLKDPINNVTIYYPTEFILSNKKSVAKVYSLDLIELLESKILSLGNGNLRNKGLIIKDKSKNNTIVSFAEIQQEISVIPPMIVFDRVRGRVGDTVKVQDHGMGDFEFADIDAELSKSTKKKVYLQLKNMTAKDQQKYFSTISVVFPTDKSVLRWIHNVEEIIVFEIK